jgi:A/G-specific adenine glycosylase
MRVINYVVMNKRKKQLIKDILQWYTKNGRDLPWRNTSDPYQVLVSEIMLQQTQVSRGIEKWHEFLVAFPTVHDLATASTAEVITVWKGLGYNRRALFLQKTAQAVVATYGGIFPKDLTALKALPGVGDYTARAVLSFAFDEPVPMMDTNHRKLYMRVFFDDWVGDRELLEKAEEVIGFLTSLNFKEKGILRLHFVSLRMTGVSEKRMHSRSVVWHWNQAIMDFMSAIARNDADLFVQQFIAEYPEITDPKKKNKKNAIPFKQTDRYIRGRIIDRLRAESTVSKRAMQSQLSEFPKERIDKNIQNLVSEGLIETVKQSIILARSTQ